MQNKPLGRTGSHAMDARDGAPSTCPACTCCTPEMESQRWSSSPASFALAPFDRVTIAEMSEEALLAAAAPSFSSLDPSGNIHSPSATGDAGTAGQRRKLFSQRGDMIRQLRFRLPPARFKVHDVPSGLRSAWLASLPWQSTVRKQRKNATCKDKAQTATGKSDRTRVRGSLCACVPSCSIGGGDGGNCRTTTTTTATTIKTTKHHQLRPSGKTKSSSQTWIPAPSL
ncbi:hypothetical protein QBC35DRAFT_285289 [Podospora australis]|uniref:Uncharacterized protein n=1 Tax=Podospora australis TaxID=1536484 RepID=A0AAN6WTD8_9PEZI|nr:hypothetical protein QBC35DRAFT_285289 [Podospora australis]